MMRFEYQKGVGLIEILVTLVVLAIGTLGLAGLQTQALKNNQSSLQRAQAVALTYAAFDMLRVNRKAATDGDYDMAMTCNPPSVTTSSTLVVRDKKYWIETLQTALGGTTCGAIDCDTNGYCTVKVQWNDERATDGGSSQVLTTRSRL